MVPTNPKEKKVAKKFPQEIYLHVDDDSQPLDEQFFSIDEKPEHFAETKRKLVAAKYKLVEVVTVQAKTIVSVRKSRRSK